MPKFIKNPIEIEAHQFPGIDKIQGNPFFDILSPFLVSAPVPPCTECGHTMQEHGRVDTLEGLHIVCVGAWVIKGIEGEFYSCKDSIFKKTYSEILEHIR